MAGTLVGSYEVTDKATRNAILVKLGERAAPFALAHSANSAIGCDRTNVTQSTVTPLPRVWPGYVINLSVFLAEDGLFRGVIQSRRDAAGLLWFIALIYWLFCIHRFHRVMREVAGAAGAPISPWKAVLSNFIPFYNFYWLFYWPSVAGGFVNRRRAQQGRAQQKWIGGAVGAGFFVGFVVAKFVLPVGLCIIFVVTHYLRQRILDVTQTSAVPLTATGE